MVHSATLMRSDTIEDGRNWYRVFRHHGWGILEKGLVQLLVVLMNGAGLLHKETVRHKGHDRIAPLVLAFRCVAENVTVQFAHFV